MATKTKSNWVKDIIVLDNKHEGLLGEIQQSELETFTVGQLKALHGDMLKDIEGDEPTTDVVVHDGDAPEGEKEAEAFASFCGSDFNPKKSGECYKQCQLDFPDAFKACVENYATLENVTGTKTRSSKPAAGKTQWGHTNGKQGGLIDTFFIEGGCGTLKEICEFSGGKDARVMHHMKHLVADTKIVLQYNFRKITEGEGDAAKTTQVMQYWWHESDKRRKGDNLVGKSAYPNK